MGAPGGAAEVYPATDRDGFGGTPTGRNRHEADVLDEGTRGQGFRCGIDATHAASPKGVDGG